MKDSGRRDNWYRAIASNYTDRQRKNWYDDVAAAYDRTRPHYPQQICDRVLELTQLPKNSSILEIGCGSGIATTEFARRGFTMACLEPSPQACQIARDNCSQYPNVEIINTTFEEWQLKPDNFDAVLAATSFHWVAPEIRHQKAAATLKDNGWLILLWNTPPQPSYEVCQLLQKVYQVYAPSLKSCEAIATHQANLSKMEEAAIDSGWFKESISEQLICKVTYNIDNYLALLSTLSPYIMLEAQQRNLLFSSLKEVLLQNCGDQIELSYLSVFQIMIRLPPFVPSSMSYEN